MRIDRKIKRCSQLRISFIVFTYLKILGDITQDFGRDNSGFGRHDFERHDPLPFLSRRKLL